MTTPSYSDREAEYVALIARFEADRPHLEREAAAAAARGAARFERRRRARYIARMAERRKFKSTHNEGNSSG